MTVPGRRIRAIASRLFSPRTLERLVDPALADLQVEYRDARSAGRIWTSRRIRLAGYVSLLRAVGEYGFRRSMESLSAWPGDERHTLNRTVRFASVASVVTIVLLILPVLRARPHALMDLVFLIPQSIPIAGPVGVTLGIFWGIGSQAVTARLTAAILILAVASSCAALVCTAWLIPAAGDASRVSLAKRALATGAQFTLTRGPLELTLHELGERIDVYTRAGNVKLARQFARTYHLRWALPCATFALALFAVSMLRRRPAGRTLRVVAAVAACAAYYAFLFAAESLAQRGALPAFAALWLPNAAFVCVSGALLIDASRRNAIQAG